MVYILYLYYTRHDPLPFRPVIWTSPWLSARASSIVLSLSRTSFDTVSNATRCCQGTQELALSLKLLANLCFCFAVELANRVLYLLCSAVGTSFLSLRFQWKQLSSAVFSLFTLLSNYPTSPESSIVVIYSLQCDITSGFLLQPLTAMKQIFSNQQCWWIVPLRPYLK